MINGDSGLIRALRRVVWNAIIPELILLYAWVKACCKKKWYFAGILTAILAKLAIIVLTQPSDWFMYVLSFYLLGYVAVVFGGLSYYEKLQKSLT